MLAYPGNWLPVFMNVIAGSWLIASVWRLLMKHSSSATVWRCGSRSLIQSPFLPQSLPPLRAGVHG